MEFHLAGLKGPHRIAFARSGLDGQPILPDSIQIRTKSGSAGWKRRNNHIAAARKKACGSRT
jgi:hypothetical protein